MAGGGRESDQVPPIRRDRVSSVFPYVLARMVPDSCMLVFPPPLRAKALDRLLCPPGL